MALPAPFSLAVLVLALWTMANLFPSFLTSAVPASAQPNHSSPTFQNASSRLSNISGPPTTTHGADWHSVDNDTPSPPNPNFSSNDFNRKQASVSSPSSGGGENVSDSSSASLHENKSLSLTAQGRKNFSATPPEMKSQAKTTPCEDESDGCGKTLTLINNADSGKILAPSTNNASGSSSSGNDVTDIGGDDDVQVIDTMKGNTNNTKYDDNNLGKSIPNGTNPFQENNFMTGTRPLPITMKTPSTKSTLTTKFSTAIKTTLTTTETTTTTTMTTRITTRKPRSRLSQVKGHSSEVKGQIAGSHGGKKKPSGGASSHKGNVSSKPTHHLAKHFTGFVQHVWLPNSTPRHPGPIDDGPFGSILWKDKKYLVSVLIPIGVGFAGAMMIIVMAYVSRAWRRRKERLAHAQGLPGPYLETATSKTDDLAPLQESSDDEF